MKNTTRMMLLASGAALITAAAFAQNYPGPRVTGGEPVMGDGGHITLAPHPITNYAPVTDAQLLNPDPNDWIMMRGNYQGYGFSPLKQVDKTNVKNLQLVWSRGMEPGINQNTPIVHDGVMFLGNPNDIIQAIDAATGEMLWQYRRTLPDISKIFSGHWGQRKRSVFLYKDRIYTVTRDNFLIALDAKTGKQLWEVNRGGDLYATNTTGPIVVNGVVVAGATCQYAPFGCFVTGNDAETGKELWRNYVIPKPGEPGSETWGNQPFEKRQMTGVWGPIIYDPELDLIFYGSSGVGPAAEGQRGNYGATMTGTNTRFAVKPRTGEIVWRHQVLPEDNWDQECTFEMMPITTAVNPDPKAEGMMAVGRGAKSASRKVLTGVPCKTGIMWSFDAAKGDFLWAKQTAVQNLVNKIDNKGKVTVNPDMIMTDINKTYPICPTHAGGRDWPFSAYSPQTNMMYVQIQNLCTDIKVRANNIPSKLVDGYNVTGISKISPGHSGIGRIDAISVETGKTVWTWETKATNYAPILATGGGLVFNGGIDRYLRAFDQADGKVLWQTRLGSHVSGAPVSFSRGGRQYIAVVAGGGFGGGISPTRFPDIDQSSGSNMVYVFALPEK
jgi:alcohol dehydrogenase (cytochrome c)